jgi:NAD(P)-dependent dehydrogenase (short-subunit alcohol dehydrogenase family)
MTTVAGGEERELIRHGRLGRPEEVAAVALFLAWSA